MTADTSMAEKLPARRRVRLPDYDYSSPGAYFVMICTQGRRCVLSNITVGADALGGPLVQLTEIGKVVEKTILSTERIEGLHVDNYVIMPNHIHMILRIDAEVGRPDNGPPRASAPTEATGTGRESVNGPPGARARAPTEAKIPSAVGALKRLVHRRVGRQIFQRSYHEHVIRDGADLRAIWEYIDGNPGKWAEDRYYTAEET